MKFIKGDRVKHPQKPEWGIGQVLENSTNDSVKMFFVEAGYKTLWLTHTAPEKVTGEEAQNALLDQLIFEKPSDEFRYKSISEAITSFLSVFPGGFTDPSYLQSERNYKTEAHKHAQSVLPKEVFKQLIDEGHYAEITSRTQKLVNMTNLIFPNEKMALKDGLKNPEHQKIFCDALYEMLFGLDELEFRFKRYIQVLSKINAEKWTIASYFPFIFDPTRFMFVKPTVTQFAAKISHFEINYKPELNWLTYRSVLAFSDYINNSIQQLHPRDMIDVQSFMWTIAPGKYIDV